MRVNVGQIAIAALAALTASVVVAQSACSPGDEPCIGGCLCNATPGTCGSGCYKSYAPSPDGGPALFVCRNAPPLCSVADGAATLDSEADLPTGACPAEEVCAAYVTVPCPNLVDEWTCTCASGNWSCALTTPSGCSLAASDAGSAPPDGGTAESGPGVSGGDAAAP